MQVTRQYVTMTEATTITGLSRSTLSRRIKDGTLPTVKWSGKVLIPVTYLMPERACT